MRFKLIAENKSFKLLWTSQIVASLGDRITQMGLLSVLLFSARDDGSKVALITFCTLLPFTLLGPLFGVIADRLSRKKLMINANFLRAVLVALVPVIWAMAKSSLVILPIVFLLGAFAALFATAKSSLIVNLVSKDDLVEANSIMATTGTVITLVGTLIAGSLIKGTGATAGFFVNAAAYFASAVLIFKVSCPQPQQEGRPALTFNGVIDDFKTGLGYIRRRKVLRNQISLSNMFAVISAFGYILVLNYGSQHLRIDEIGLGWLLSSLGFGMILGALILYKRKDKVNFNRALYVSFLIIGVFLSLFFVAPGYYTSLLILFCLGVGASILPITMDTIVNRISPDEIRSKIFSVRAAISNAVFLISLLVVGWLIKVAPVTHIFTGLGALSLAVFLMIYCENRRWGYQLTRLTVKAMMRYMFSLKVTGLENLPKTRRVILAGNHTSVLDGIIVASAYPGRVYFMVADNSFKIMPWGWVLNRMGYIPVKRGGFNKDSIKHAVNLIKSGFALGIFPEGRITPDGRLEEGKMGVAMIAKLADADIIPFAIEGAYEAWNVSKKKMKSFPIEIRFGKPIDSSQFEVQQELVQELMKEISTVKLELEREGYLRVDPDEIVKHLINIG